jgi:putative transposase
MSHLSYKAERAGRRVVKVDPRNTSLNILHAGSGLPREPVDRKPLLYIPFSEGVYSKFPGRSRKFSPRGEDAPSERAG